MLRNGNAQQAGVLTAGFDGVLIQGCRDEAGPAGRNDFRACFAHEGDSALMGEEGVETRAVMTGEERSGDLNLLQAEIG